MVDGNYGAVVGLWIAERLTEIEKKQDKILRLLDPDGDYPETDYYKLSDELKEELA